MVAREPPYTLSRAAEEVHQMAHGHEWAEELELGGGAAEQQSVPLLRIAEGDRVAARRFGIWIQAQQKPCDMASSWVCQGVMHWMTGDSVEAQWLRQNAEIHCVPVLNAGAAGADLSAARGMLSDLATEERLDVFVDLQAITSEKFKLKLWPSINASRGVGTEFCTWLGKAWPGLEIMCLEEPPYAKKERGQHPTADGISKDNQATSEWAASQGDESTLAITLWIPNRTSGATLESYDATGAAMVRVVERYLEIRSRREGR